MPLDDDINPTVTWPCHGAAHDYYHLGSVCEKRQEYKTAESYYRRALAIAEDARDRQSAARGYRAMGGIAKATESWQKAIHWYRKALQISLSGHDPRGASMAYSLLAQVYIKTENGQAVVSACLSALTLDMEHNEDLIGCNIHILGQLLKQVGIDEFQCLWHAIIAAPCPDQLLELTRQASQVLPQQRSSIEG